MMIRLNEICANNNKAKMNIVTTQGIIILTWVTINLGLQDIQIAKDSSIIAAIGVVICFGISLAESRGLNNSLTVLILYIILLAGGVLCNDVGIHMTWWLGCCIICYSAIYTIAYIKRKNKSVIYRIIIGSIVLLGARRKSHFDVDNLIDTGQISHDLLYHSALAGMLSKYGITTTGLNGLVETPYHSFSHLLYSSLQGISGLAILKIYVMATILIFSPLLVYYFTRLTEVYAGQYKYKTNKAFIIVSLSIFIAPLLLRKWNFWFGMYGSESYIIALILFATNLEVLYKRKKPEVNEEVIGLISIIIMTLSKASVGAFYLILWWARIFCEKNFCVRRIIFPTISTFATYQALVGNASNNSKMMSYAPLDFIKEYSLWGQVLNGQEFIHNTGNTLQISVAILSVTSFILMHYIISWFVIFFIEKKEQMIPFGIIVTSTMISVGIGALVRIPNGSAFYFTNLAFCTALPISACIMEEKYKYMERWGKIIGITIILITMIAGLKGIEYQISPVNTKDKSIELAKLRGKLEIIRKKKSKEIFLLDEELAKLNKLPECHVRPYLYPAVSETAWIHTIQDPISCDYYKNFGYSNYGLTHEGDRKIIQKVDGRKIIRAN